MLSKERLQEVGRLLRLNPRDPVEEMISRQEILWMIDERLVLHALPEMAEVDALEAMFGGCVIADQRIHFESACELARQAIATAHAERQRADEAEILVEGRREAVINKEEFDARISERRTLYGIAAQYARSDELKNAAKDVLDLCDLAEKLAGIAVSHNEQITTLTTERDEARRLLKISMDANLSYHDLQVVLEGRSSLRLSKLSQADAARILELCNGGRDDTRD